MLELEDGPSTELRPTIDIAKLNAWGLGGLVNVNAVNYYTYYVCSNAEGTAVQCLCPNEEGEMETCPDVASRELMTQSGSCPAGQECSGPFSGIMTDDPGIVPAGTDFDFAAAFLAAAADKTGDIGVDMVVYINSILGLNKLIGYSEYDADGQPADGAVNYEKNPVYFNYGAAAGVFGYSRLTTFTNRGQVVTEGGQGTAPTYDGNVTVLQATGPGLWAETAMPIIDSATFDNLGLGADGFPTGQTVATDYIIGFSQMADDDLSVIEFIHTYQIPGLR
jgi:hypothetical protein